MIIGKELMFRAKISALGTGYGFRVPKTLVDLGYFEVGKHYKFVVVEIEEKKDRKEY